MSGRHIEGGFDFWGDNKTLKGVLVENKAAVANGGGRASIQLRNYLRYLRENGGSLDYRFFRSPAGSPVGPTSRFASMLADAATKYDIGFRIIDHDWWEELQ
jgi:hypothetical protein